MHEYDTVLKALLQSPQNNVVETVMGRPIQRWLNVEFPEVQQTRVDMLGVTGQGGLGAFCARRTQRDGQLCPPEMKLGRLTVSFGGQSSPSLCSWNCRAGTI